MYGKKSVSSLVIALCLLSSTMYAQTAPDALELYRQGKYQESADACLAEIQRTPRNVESHVVLGWALLSLGRYEEAVSWSLKGRELSKYDPRLIEIQAEAKYWLGSNDESLKLFQEYISYTPNGSRIALTYYYMGEIYLRQGKFRHADIAFSSAIQLDGLNAQWWSRLGYAREMAKEYRYSLEAYNKALALNTTLQDAVRGRERVLGHLN
jgi:tetratricopeptide (TPR) repeat protein